MSDLRKEFTDIDYIYQQQKEYRKTPKGKDALKRAQKKWSEKKKLENLRMLSGLRKPRCSCCNENIFEFLTIKNDKVLCYNCKSQKNCPHQIKEEGIKIANR